MMRHQLTLLLGALVFLLFPGGMIAAQDLDACQQMVDDALADLTANCANMVPNSACYGDGLVDVLFFDSFTVPDDLFSTPGDHVNLRMVEQFMPAEETMPADSWGIVVLQTQTNIPLEETASPTMIVFGNTILTNTVLPADAVEVVMADGQQTPMQSFSLILGEEVPVCEQMLTGLLLQLPEGAEVTFLAGGAALQLSANICTIAIIQNDPNRADTYLLEVISGQVTVFAGMDFPVTLNTGYQVSLSLDEEGLFIIPTSFADYQALLETVQIMPDEELARLTALEDLPLNILSCPFVLPEIVRPSGVGAPEVIIIPGS